MDKALARFHRAVSASLAPGSYVLAHTYETGIEGCDATFLAGVVLPGLPGRPMIVGTLPQQPVFHPYRNEPPRVG